MKKKSTRLFLSILIMTSLFATIHLNTVCKDFSSTQSEVVNRVIPAETPPAESILPEVQVVKTILHKFLEL